MLTRGNNRNPEEIAVRHALPEFGRVPRAFSDSMSGIVRSAVAIAFMQANTGQRIQLFGLNRGFGRMSYTLDGIEIHTNSGNQLFKTRRNDWRYFVPLYRDALMCGRARIMHVHDNPFELVLPRAQYRVLHIHTPVWTRPLPHSAGPLIARNM